MFCAFKLMQVQSKNTIYLNNIKYVGEEQAKENEGRDYLLEKKEKENGNCNVCVVIMLMSRRNMSHFWNKVGQKHPTTTTKRTLNQTLIACFYSVEEQD